MNWPKFLQRRQPKDRESDLLHEARMKLIEHEAAAEHYDALATMYKHRVERLEQSLGYDVRITNAGGLVDVR
jgi:hypothetical protein